MSAVFVGLCRGTGGRRREVTEEEGEMHEGKLGKWGQILIKANGQFASVSLTLRRRRRWSSKCYGNRALGLSRVTLPISP